MQRDESKKMRKFKGIKFPGIYKIIGRLFMMRKKDMKSIDNISAGDILKEIREIEALQKESTEGIYTITANCGELLTIVCC